MFSLGFLAFFTVGFLGIDGILDLTFLLATDLRPLLPERDYCLDFYEAREDYLGMVATEVRFEDG